MMVALPQGKRLKTAELMKTGNKGRMGVVSKEKSWSKSDGGQAFMYALLVPPWSSIGSAWWFPFSVQVIPENLGGR